MTGFSTSRIHPDPSGFDWAVDQAPITARDLWTEFEKIDHRHVIDNLGRAGYRLAANIGKICAGDDIEIGSVYAEELVGPTGFSLYPSIEETILEGGADH